MNDAVLAWRALLRDGQLDDSPGTIDQYSRSTQIKGTRPCCVLYPKSTEDVQAIVRIAARHRVVVYPISRGKNWGYGDACAPTDGAAILDFSRMDRILEVNDELAYAVIEPGVSQGQLKSYLDAHHPDLWMDCTGAGADASLVGNTLDRGFGHTRYGDHVLTTCGMEVVLADGRVLNTGFGHYPNAKAARVFRYGVGPMLDGLFCQSNYGIVTKIGLWLMPRPEAFCTFFILLEHDEDIGPLVDRLRPLRLSGVLESALHIANDYRIFSSRGRYPFDQTGGRTPLPQEVRRRLRDSLRIGAWNVAGAFTGTRAHVRASRHALKRALAGLGELRFIDDRTMQRALRVVGFAARHGVARPLYGLLTSIEPVFATLKGVPTDDAVRGTHWRLRNAPGDGVSDPLELGAGLLWVSPVLPMLGSEALNVMAIVEPIFAEYGFEPLATMTMINERAMIGVMNVSFDKSVPEEAARAMQCHDALNRALLDKGYVPYRAGLSSMPLLNGRDDTFWQVASQIKAALDPLDIISRGRYVPPLE